MSADAGPRGIAPQLARIVAEPYYQPIGDEVALFESAHRRRLPVLLKGPTGCGKTRFVEYMAWRLQRPLVTVACHDDLTTADLVGRYLIVGNETVWVDGPLTAAVRAGAICYLDEIVEARKDTTVVIHPLADARRILAVDKRGELVAAPADFMLVVSYNPGYQSVLKEIKPSTRQRFVALDFDYPEAAIEAGIVAAEGGVDAETARRLVKLAELTRNLKGAGLDEGASTRLLVHAGKLIAAGNFTIIGGVAANYIASWDGSVWSPLGAGMSSNVYALTVYDGKLIAGGYFWTAGGVDASRVAAWDGTTWSPLGSGVNGTVYSLGEFNGNLIVGGQFNLAGTVSATAIAAWDGSIWTAYGLGISATSYVGYVAAVTEYEGELIAAGRFSTASGGPVGPRRRRLGSGSRS